MAGVPITEQSCPITENIDVASAPEIVQLLHESDKLIFNGYKQCKTIYDYCDVIEQAINQATSILQADDSCVILSGCGTSGRLGFLTARSFNNILRRDLRSVAKFHYVLAGGDEALFLSKELIEDDPTAGVNDLIEACRDKSRVLYIGITCGLSSAYVAGQLEYAFKHPEKFYRVLIGFNPIELARNTTVENWDKTFRDVAQTFEKSGCGSIITPVYGPEPITGSSRMKGGTTTKIILDTIFSCAILRMLHPETPITAREIIDSYKCMQTTVFSKTVEIGQYIEHFGNALNHNRHIYYISDNRVGVFGLIDASECPPTYGSDVDDVRGFIQNGYADLDTNEGDSSHIMDISLDYFKEHVMPTLTTNDVICVLQACESLERYLKVIKARIVRIMIGSAATSRDLRDDYILLINISSGPLSEILPADVSAFMRPFHTEIAIKWICNCLTTGAHIMKGKVYRNHMIDVRVRNDKLYRRAIRIVHKLAGISEQIAERSLLKAIYQTDVINVAILEGAISKHIDKATNMDQVVPMATIIAKRHCDIQCATEMLRKCSRLREALTAN